MTNMQVSVHIFHEADIYEIMSVTDSKVLLSDCMSEDMFRYKDNGGMICAGYPMDSIYGFEKLRKYILKLKNDSSYANHVVIFVSEVSPSPVYGINEVKDYFKDWKTDGIEFITLRLNNPEVTYDVHKGPGGEPMNYDLYRELATIPEWTKTGDYETICLLLTQIGKSLGIIATTREIPESFKQYWQNNLDEIEKNGIERHRQWVEEKERRKEERTAAIRESIEKESIRKTKFAYMSIIAAVATIILYMGRSGLCFPCVIFCLITGYMGRESKKETLSKVGLIIGIIEFIFMGYRIIG